MRSQIATSKNSSVSITVHHDVNTVNKQTRNMAIHLQETKRAGEHKADPLPQKHYRLA